MNEKRISQTLFVCHLNRGNDICTVSQYYLCHNQERSPQRKQVVQAMQRWKAAPTAITQCEGCQVHLMLDMDLQGSEMMAAAWRKPLHMGEL